MRPIAWLKTHLIDGLRRMDATDLRWSYLVLAGMLAVGVVLNCFLPHGWTVWPFVAAAALMMAIHEAAERNTDGVPPFQVYALFASAIAVWLLVVFVLSAVNFLIELLGLAAIGYFVARGIIRQRERVRVVEGWRAEGRCIHCGEPADPKSAICLACGEEPDPDKTRLKRVADTAQTLKRTERLRSALTPEPPTATAARKERALLARRQKGPGRKGK